MEKEKASKIGFINKGDTGMWGNLTYNEKKYLVRNVRRRDGTHTMTGDIQIETGNTYLNKAGKVCKEYARVGAIVFSKDSGKMVLEEGGKKFTDEFVVSKHDGDRGEYLMLTFEEENPYLKDLICNEPVPAEDSVGEEPAGIDDEVPF